MFDHNAAFATAHEVMSDDEERPSVNQMVMTFDEERQVTLEATDAYRAVRIKMPYTPTDYILDSGPRAWTPTKGQPITLAGWEQFSEPVEHAIPNLSSIYAKAWDESTMYVVNLAAPYKQAIGDFGYFDGERRRPSGLIQLEWVTGIGDRLEIDARRGMRVQGDTRIGRNFVAWEEVPSPIGTVQNGDPSEIEDTVMGVYSAHYLGPIDRAFTIGHASAYKPLLMLTNGGTQEHLVMPIRMPA